MLDSPVHDVLIDVAEIDCAVVSAAHKYFDLPSGDERLNVTCRDARIAVREAQRNKRKFDLISHDIFTGGDLAFPLFTLQFFQQLASILSQDGTLSINYVWSTKDNEIALQSLVKTLKQVFATVTIYLENGEVNEINNLVIFCKLQNPLVLAIPDSGRTPKTNLGVVAVRGLFSNVLANCSVN
jgi:spermidine synthase